MRVRGVYAAFLWAATLFIGVGAFAWAIDPYQFFRQARSFTPTISSNPRMHIPAMARVLEYDTAIVGSSTASGMRPSYLRPRFTAARLSMDGGTLNETTRLLRFLLRHREVPQVIWGVDTFLLSNSTDAYSFPRFVSRMLDGNPLWIPTYLYHSATQRAAWGSLLGLSGPAADLEAHLDYTNRAIFSPEALERAFAARPRRSLHSLEEWHAALAGVPTAYRWIVNTTILRIVRENPRTHFYIYFTPVSVYWHRSTPIGTLAEEMALKAYLLQELARLPNVSVLDFQCDRSITFNTNVFADLVHYNADINRRIAAAMVADERPSCDPAALYVDVIDAARSHSIAATQ